MKSSHRYFLSHDKIRRTEGTLHRVAFILPEQEALALPLFPLVVLRENFQTPMIVHHANYYLFALEIPLEGNITIREREQKITVKPGEAGVIHPGEDSELCCNPSPLCRKLAILFTGTQLPGILASTGISTKLKLIPPDFKHFLGLVLRIETLLLSKDPSAIPELSGLALQILMLFRDRFPQSRHQELTSRAADLLRNNLANSIQISTIAETLNISTATLCRLFQEHYGRSPKEYFQEIRLERARNLLTATNSSIKQIALQTGFQSPSFFTKTFRAFTGFAPAQWRDMQKQKKD